MKKTSLLLFIFLLIPLFPIFPSVSQTRTHEISQAMPPTMMSQDLGQTPSQIVSQNEIDNSGHSGPIEIKPDTEVIIKERRKKNADGSEETEIRSGRVKPPRSEPPRVGELTEDEMTRVVKRVETLHLWSFGLGPGNATNMANPNMFYTFNFSHHMEVNPNGELRFGGFTSLPSKAKGNLTVLELGGSWFPSTLDISPILGATFGMGSVVTEDRDLTGGFSLGVHAGMRFFRTAKAQMSLEANLKTLFVSGEKPTMMSIQLGILY